MVTVLAAAVLASGWQAAAARGRSAAAPSEPSPGGAAPPATWRLDYYHTGGLGTELFAVDRYAPTAAEP